MNPAARARAKPRKNDKVAKRGAARTGRDYDHFGLFIFKRAWELGRDRVVSAERIIRHLQIVRQLQLQCGGNRGAEDDARRGEA